MHFRELRGLSARSYFFLSGFGSSAAACFFSWCRRSCFCWKRWLAFRSLIVGRYLAPMRQGRRQSAASAIRIVLGENAVCVDSAAHFLIPGAWLAPTNGYNSDHE